MLRCARLHLVVNFIYCKYIHSFQLQLEESSGENHKQYFFDIYLISFNLDSNYTDDLDSEKDTVAAE